MLPLDPDDVWHTITGFYLTWNWKLVIKKIMKIAIFLPFRMQKHNRYDLLLTNFSPSPPLLQWTLRVGLLSEQVDQHVTLYWLLHQQEIWRGLLLRHQQQHQLRGQEDGQSQPENRLEQKIWLDEEKIKLQFLFSLKYFDHINDIQCFDIIVFRNRFSFSRGWF